MFHCRPVHHQVIVYLRQYLDPQCTVHTYVLQKLEQLTDKMFISNDVNVDYGSDGAADD